MKLLKLTRIENDDGAGPIYMNPNCIVVVQSESGITVIRTALNSSGCALTWDVEESVSEVIAMLEDSENGT